jgi:hypothetical protein
VFDLAEELDSIRNVLSERGIEFAVCGGMAMAIHGFVRATVDLDLLVKPEDVDVIEETVASLGYIIEPQRLSKIDPIDGDAMTLDLFLVTSESRKAWESRQVISWCKKPLPVVSRDGLIALKRLRASAYDLVDIDRLPIEEVDASDKATSLRMRRVAQLRNLCLSLGKAGAEARRKGQLPPLTPSTSRAETDPRSDETHPDSD